MPGPTSPKQIRRNFVMRQTDSDLLDELARLVAHGDEEPNYSRAVRIAVREALDKRRKPAKDKR